jgi:hypothetical protein
MGARRLGPRRPDAEAEAKRELLRWRLHALLADLTGDLAHRYEAVVARPNLPSTRIDLGCDLARVNRFGEAIPHLRRAVADLPFELDARAPCSRPLGRSVTPRGSAAWLTTAVCWSGRPPRSCRRSPGLPTCRGPPGCRCA